MTDRRNLRLGPIPLDSPAVLAPMAGYTDSPMRRICRRYGAGMVFSEMLSSEGARRDNEKTFKMAAFESEERPYSIQLFANDPDQVVDAIDVLSAVNPDSFDLNFGCPAKKIVQGSSGSALLKDIPQLARILTAAVKATPLPVSIKIRGGWDYQSLNSVEVARAAEECGAAWITMHARTRSEFYTGRAKWEWIGEVKSAVSIPVIGNGDVKTAADAIKLLETTGCDAVMIGRAAMGYPFIFREINHYLEHGEYPQPPTPAERFEAAKMQLQWMVENTHENRAVLEFRKHLLTYVRGLHGCVRFKNEAMKLVEAKDVIEALHEFISTLPDDPVLRPELPQGIFPPRATEDPTASESDSIPE